MRKFFLMPLIAALVGAASFETVEACGGCGASGGGMSRGVSSGRRASAGRKVLAAAPSPAGRTALEASRRPARSAAPVRVAAAKKQDGQPAPQAPLYSCPMHPQVQWTKPTDCPICGMKLKPKGAKPARGGDPDVMDDMPGMEMGGMDDMDDMMMCCPGCMMNMGGMSKMNGKQPPAAGRKASRGSMGAMAGMGCGC